MPWFIDASDTGIFGSIRHSRSTKDGSRGRLQELGLNSYQLYALGIDAYRLIPHLAKMRYKRELEIRGGTGGLRVDYDGVVHRKMSWLKFVRGLPHSLDELRDPHVH